MVAFDDIHFDKDENYIYALNEESYKNHLSNGFGSNDFFVALTNKRVYFREIKNNITSKVQKSNTIDLKNISSIEISTLSYTILLLLGIISFVGGIFYYFSNDSQSSQFTDLDFYIIFFLMMSCMMFILAYIVTYSKQMIIHYQGGEISFSIRFLSPESIISFQKLLFTAKENAILNETKQTNGGNNDETPA